MFSIQHYESFDGTALRYGVLTNPQRPKDCKRALLFVPGLGGSVKDALNFLERLLPEFDPIYAPDLRGFGLNEDKPLPHPDVFLKDLTAFQKERQLDSHPALTLAGISLGGATATQLAIQQPESFKNLILIAPAYRASGVSFPPSYILKNIFGRLLGGRQHKIQLPYSTEALTRNPVVLESPEYKDRPALMVSSGFLLQVALFNFKAFQQTRQISIPTLMLVPGKDIICDPEYMRKGFQRIPEKVKNTLMKEYPALFHDVLLEPELPTLAEDVLQWIRLF